MFNVRDAKFVPGFRVKDPRDDVPGFRVGPDESAGRSATDFPSYGSLDSDRNRWFSDYLRDANDRFATNPYLSGDLASQIGQARQYLNDWNSERWSYPFQMLAANDPDSAWGRCHTRCVGQTVGRGLPDSFGAYRRCMRACLNSKGVPDY